MMSSNLAPRDSNLVSGKSFWEAVFHATAYDL